MHKTNTEPADAGQRRKAKPVICYNVDELPHVDRDFYAAARGNMTKVGEVKIEPRDAATFEVPAGHLFRIVSIEGSQVGDLNLWNADDLTERFFSGKTRQLHASHVTTGDRLWSSIPGLRPMATITHDTLDWYGWDEDGGGVHDVIGTRCDPYTNHMLNGVDYHYCCHSNLSRALARKTGLPIREAELHVHDVLNVFMCTGFTKDSYQYFMKASPVRPGDYIEFFAEIDLLGALSACPGAIARPAIQMTQPLAIHYWWKSINRTHPSCPGGRERPETAIQGAMDYPNNDKLLNRHSFNLALAEA